MFTSPHIYDAHSSDLCRKLFNMWVLNQLQHGVAKDDQGTLTRALYHMHQHEVSPLN